MLLQIIWIPLGQNPVMDKLQRSMFNQLTGKDLPADFTSSSDDEKRALLAAAFKGNKILLALGAQGAEA